VISAVIEATRVTRPIQRKLVLENRLEEVSRCEDVLLADLDAMGFGGADRFAIKLALEEALANAIKHGNACDQAKHVTVDYDVNPQQVRISVCDEGCGFDPADVPDPTLDENLEKPHGRGVMLMRTYMSDVSFNKSGNCVTMVKQRTPATAEGPAASGR
jgi:serine/threonine-protein kinase RsbW